MQPIYQLINQLIAYGLREHLIEPIDSLFVRNRMLKALGLDRFEIPEIDEEPGELYPILEGILDWAYENGRIPSRFADYADLLDTELMGYMTPRPSEVVHKFNGLYQADPSRATYWFYQLSRASHYIRTDRTAKNKHWTVESDYGLMDITINLSKPEKDPKAIAAARNAEETKYPQCLLCLENLGYGGRPDHPARQNIRVIPVALNSENWYLQYSPYVYYNEHAIIFSETHHPMKIAKETFNRLLDFVDWLPHYFIGSNADLPIVGGSMLSHDHYQGGRYTFAMEKASTIKELMVEGYPNVTFSWLNWPLTVLRLESVDRQSLLEAADRVRTVWGSYSDESVEIAAYSGDIPHNTLTPIARKSNGYYQLDLVLRNNRQNSEHPDGIFHPHKEIHGVKKENIGLIEVMGLAVLPDRLVREMTQLEEILKAGNISETLERQPQFMPFEGVLKLAEQGCQQGLTPEAAVRNSIGLFFVKGLEHCGVIKNTEAGHQAMDRLVAALNCGA